MNPVSYQLLACQRGGNIGVATINLEAKLNVLNQAVVDSLYKQLHQWQQDDEVVCIWLQGSGSKAFCAGGDVRALQQAIVRQGADSALPQVQRFFETEYRLDYLLHRYSKPVIAWGNGFVMGGGLGLLAAASHAVVTDHSVLAMPEITIGLYPDVGASFFLQQAPGRCGLFMGLTGSRASGADALFLGWANHLIPQSQKDQVLAQLRQQVWAGQPAADAVRVTTVLKQSELQPLPDSAIAERSQQIEQLTAADSLPAIVQACQQQHWSDPWLTQAAKNLDDGCPVTAHLVYQQWRRGASLSLAEAFRMELVMSVQCALHPDFPEGVRAALVDKDRSPQWRFRSVDEVPDTWVEAHFQPPWPEGQHPLRDLE